MNLVLSTLALLLGPAVYGLCRRSQTARKALGALVVLTIAWIVGAHIIPEAYAAGGKPFLLFFALGIAFPLVLHYVFHVATHTERVALLSLAAAALVLHALIDGLALLPGEGSHVASAVIIHRLPVGVAIWWTFRPTAGRAAAITAFALIIAGTAVGYFLGAPVLEITSHRHMAWFQAFVSGSLVDLVIMEFIARIRRSR